MKRDEERRRLRLRRELIDTFEANEAAIEVCVSAPTLKEIALEEERLLRSLDRRIGRSRRSGRELRAWAMSVLGREKFMEVTATFRERRTEERRRAMERQKELETRLHSLLEASRPEPGPEREWRVHRWSHEGRFGAERTAARDMARCDVAVSRSMGLEARYEELPGRIEPSPYTRWVPQGVLVGAGFRVFVGVAHAIDLEILRKRAVVVDQEWTRRLMECKNEGYGDYVREREAFLSSGD